MNSFEMGCVAKSVIIVAEKDFCLLLIWFFLLS